MAATNNVSYKNAIFIMSESDGDYYTSSYTVGQTKTYGYACTQLGIQFTLYSLPAKNGDITINYYLYSPSGSATYSLDYTVNDNLKYTVNDLKFGENSVTFSVTNATSVTVFLRINNTDKQTAKVGALSYEFSTGSTDESAETSKNIFQLLQSFIGNFWSSFLKGLENSFDTLIQKFSWLQDFVTGFWSKFITTIQNAFISLYVPDETFFEEWLEEQYEYVNDHLGALAYSADFMYDLFSAIISSNTGEPILYFPGITVNLGNLGTYTIAESQTINMNELTKEFSVLVNMMKFGTSVVLVGGFLYFAQSLKDDILM